MSGLTRRSVNVIMLGRMGFMPAYDVQNRYARQHLDEMAGHPNARGENTLLLVEHSPVYTVGIRNKDYTQDDVTRLKATGAHFYTSNRGGLITFHGPGQLVAYPILNLRNFKPSMKWYVCQLEKTLMETLKQFGITGRLTDQTGVWVDDRKIASIGLHGSRYVTTHGISLNCNTDLSWFKAIEPCGLKGVEMTSLTNELKMDVSMQDAAKPFLRSFQEVFDCDLEYRMLDDQDKETLDKSAAPLSTTDANAEAASEDAATQKTSEGVSAPRVDQRVEIGIRLMSTLSSSSSSSSSSFLSSPSSNTVTPSSLSSSSSPLSSSSFPRQIQYNTASGSEAPVAEPGIIRRLGPMW